MQLRGGGCTYYLLQIAPAEQASWVVPIVVDKEGAGSSVSCPGLRRSICPLPDIYVRWEQFLEDRLHDLTPAKRSGDRNA